MAFPPLPLDLSFSHFIQAFHPEWLIWVAKIWGFITEPAFLIGIFLLIILILYRKGKRLTATKITLLLAGNSLTPFLKWIFARPRPNADQIQVFFHEAGYGFPSGHALGAVLFAATILVLLNQKNWFAYVLATVVVLAVGISRIFLGVHWLTDILFGYLIGTVWTIICIKFFWPLLNNFFSSEKSNP
jgi:undecaprenyl-diphosphatase